MKMNKSKSPADSSPSLSAESALLVVFASCRRIKMTEEEVAMEMEALEAVYGDDCVILDSYPPHLHLHIKPRTAEISSQQFVEAVLRIQAGSKYPDETPQISLIESKGLDEQRQKHLMGSVQEKASELSYSLMLVALCEEAVERLTIMNHPDGDCPLCLYPLFPEDGGSKQMPFMKLMSCFHCFHCECIIRWWNWLHTQKEADSKNGDTIIHLRRETSDQEGNTGSADKSLGNCPVCRKVFHASDIDHVLDLVGSHSSQQDSGLVQGEEEDPLLQSDSENIRRERFEAILKTQEEKGGLVQPKKNISVVPGMYLPTPAPASSLSNQEEACQSQEQVEHKEAESETNSSSSNNRRGRGRGRSRGGSRGGGRGHNNVNRRKHNSQDPRKPTTQWVQKS